MQGDSMSGLHYIPANVPLLLYSHIAKAEKALESFSYHEGSHSMTSSKSNYLSKVLLLTASHWRLTSQCKYFPEGRKNHSVTLRSLYRVSVQLNLESKIDTEVSTQIFWRHECSST